MKIMPHNAETQYQLELAAAVQSMREEEQDKFFESMDDNDEWFIPTKEDAQEVIARVNGQYYLWVDGMELVLLVPIRFEGELTN